MQANFQQFIATLNLNHSSEKTLLAVSGGIDSIAMCELFYQENLPFGIIHCNFKLRGKAADEDEVFVKNLANKYQVSFYSTSFNTKKCAEELGISIQMAARKLRYEWFEEIRKEEQYTYIAIAQHRDDELETILINLLRGTGIAGLHGIAGNKNAVIRPLLFSDRTQIEHFVKTYELQFREDATNTEIKYIRNKIRHQIIPILKEINPQLTKTIAQNSAYIKDAELIFRTTIAARKEELFEFLNPYGFKASVIANIIAALNSTSGKQFLSNSHR